MVVNNVALVVQIKEMMELLDTRFFTLNKEQKVKTVWSNCFLCQAAKKIPKEIHNFDANVMPEHPGKSFTDDVMKILKKNVVVTCDNFLGFISTTFSPTENSKDLLDSLILTIFPFRSSSSATVRIDQAPGFRKLIKKETDMTELGLVLEPGEAKNKNALAIVDKKISELQEEIKKVCKVPNTIDVATLAKATAAVNEKIRHQGLSAKEILFSRDQFNNDNIPLEDEQIAEAVMKERQYRNPISARSKSKNKVKAEPSTATKGDLVFLKEEGDKQNVRDLYLVTHDDPDSEYMTICKLNNTFNKNTVSFQPHN